LAQAGDHGSMGNMAMMEEGDELMEGEHQPVGMMMM
jgi:hypothetical protein